MPIRKHNRRAAFIGFESACEGVLRLCRLKGTVSASDITHEGIITDADGGTVRLDAGANGTLLVVGASAEPIEVSPNQLLFGRKRIQGWPGGIPTDSEDTLRFAEMTGVRPMIEKLPLEKAPEAYARMIEGKARFRMVLVVG